MKKCTTLIFIIVVVMFSIVPFSQVNVFASAEKYDSIGKGTKEEPYEIGNLSQLTDLANAVNGFSPYAKANNMNGKYFILTNDIGTSSDALLTPIGKSGANFGGIFDGQGHTVTIQIDFCEYAGLFGAINKNAIVTNVNAAGEINSEDGNKGTGGICGYNSGTITNCTNKGTINSTGLLSYIGGIVGVNYGTIKNCINNGNLLTGATTCLGGICGMNTKVLDNCINTGTVKGSEVPSSSTAKIGGICGANYCTNSETTVITTFITNSINNGSVYTASNTTSIGGVVGYNESGLLSNNANLGDIYIAEGINAARVGGVCAHSKNGYNIPELNIQLINCYSSATITGKAKTVGGVCGNLTGNITNCYFDKDKYDGNVIATLNDAKAFNSAGLPTSQMLAASGDTSIDSGILDNKPLVDLLNEYTDNSTGSYPSDWFKWETRNGSLPGSTYYVNNFVPDPVDPEPIDPDPIGPDPVDPDPIGPDPVDPDPVGPDPVDPDPIGPDPVDPDPIGPGPADPDPENPASSNDFVIIYDEVVPKTGDSNNLLLFILSLSSTFAGLSVYAIAHKKIEN